MAIDELMVESPEGQQVRRLFGSEWFRSLDKLKRLSPDLYTAGPTILEMGKAQKLVSIRTRAILSHWTTLRNKGKVADFRKTWLRLTEPTRHSWLRRRFAKLSYEPHSEIYAWVQNPEQGGTHLDKRLFITPLLNVQDLSGGEVLPKFIETRATFHPALFRTLDGRSIGLGMIGGHLEKLLVPDAILSFREGEECLASLEHRQCRRGVADISGTNEMHPGLGFHCLEAQYDTYTFLAGCLKALLDESEFDAGVEASHDHPGGHGYLPLLTRCSRLDYYGLPETIDLSYLGNLLRASLDEALDDLWLLRRQAEIWVDSVIV